MIGNSLNRFNRNIRSTNAIAVPLHDRGSRKIPTQPNHCLPILPAPVIPTRSSYMIRSQISQALKLARASDIVDEENAKSPAVEANNDPEKEKGAALFPEQSQKQKTSSEETNSVFETNQNSSSIKIIDHVKPITDEESEESEIDPTKNSKKRKTSSDVNSDNEPKKLSAHSKAKIDNERKTKHCNDKKFPTSTVVGSTTEVDTEKEKTVPPLRLKKVVNQGNLKRTKTNYLIIKNHHYFIAFH